MQLDDTLRGFPGLIVPADLARLGYDPRALRGAEARGAVHRVRRGSYVARDVWGALDPRGQHLLKMRAAADTLADPVFSHWSAATAWGLPALGTPTDEVHVLGRWHGGGWSSPGVRRHSTTGEIDVTSHAGLRVTSPAATVVDLARSQSFASGLIAADHALRALLCDEGELVAAADAAVRRSYGRVARRVVGHADARSESVGESLSRARMIELGVELPELQHEVIDGRGLVGRVDFWWARHCLVGEFDGRLKYRADGVQDPRRVEERVWAEKRREDRLRATGLRVVRWTWEEALDVARMAEVLASAGLDPAGLGAAGSRPRP